jgi:hypothetical protein
MDVANSQFPGTVVSKARTGAVQVLNLTRPGLLKLAQLIPRLALSVPIFAIVGAERAQHPVAKRRLYGAAALVAL